MGVEITYPPLAHLPRSMVRHRSLQNGNSGSSLSTSLRQVGHRKLRIFFLGISKTGASCEVLHSSPASHPVPRA